MIVLGAGAAGPTALLLPMDRAGIARAPARQHDRRQALRARARRRGDPARRSARRARRRLGAAGPRASASAPSPGARRWRAPRSVCSSSAWSTPACACRAAGPSAATRPSSTPARISSATSRARAGSRGKPRGSSDRAGPTPTPRSPRPRPTRAEAGLRVARRGHQIMGAIGYCEEHPLHLFHKRILAAASGRGRRGAAPGDGRHAIGLGASPLRDLAALDRHRYLALATFRRSGAEVRTPVWFAAMDGKIYVFTAGDSGKVKRLRHSSRARVAPSEDARARSRRVVGRGRAAIVTEPAVIERAHAALRAKYGWQMWLGDLFSRLSGRSAAPGLDRDRGLSRGLAGEPFTRPGPRSGSRAAGSPPRCSSTGSCGECPRTRRGSSPRWRRERSSDSGARGSSRG